MGGSDALQYRHLSRRAHDVDQRHAIGPADLYQHLPEVGRSGGVDDGAVAFSANRLDKTQCGERVDEAGGALLSRRAFGQQQCFLGLHHAVIRVRRAADDGDLAAQQMLFAGAGRDHSARTFIAARHRLIGARRHRPHQRWRHGGTNGAGLAARR